MRWCVWQSDRHPVKTDGCHQALAWWLAAWCMGRGRKNNHTRVFFSKRIFFSFMKLNPLLDRWADKANPWIQTKMTDCMCVYIVFGSRKNNQARVVCKSFDLKGFFRVSARSEREKFSFRVHTFSLTSDLIPQQQQQQQHGGQAVQVKSASISGLTDDYWVTQLAVSQPAWLRELLRASRTTLHT